MRKSLALIMLIFIVACSSEKSSIDASKLNVEWKLVRNNYDGKGNFLASLTFTNNSDVDLPREGWQIFFNLRYHGADLKSQNATIAHINGELFTISGFSVPSKASKEIQFSGERRIANFQDVPSGFFFVGQDDKPIEITRTVVKPQILDLPPTRDETKLPVIRDQIRILPTPVKYVADRGIFTITDKTIITSEFETGYLIGEIEKLTGYKLNAGSNGAIRISKTNGPAESYSLVVNSQQITIAAADGAGAFYAIQSLKQLFPPDSWRSKKEMIEVEAVEIHDQPRFPVREFMLDVGRNFESKTNILRLLEVMSLYKLNTFHFHFNDDEGWRLEIPGLPELTDIGSKRGYPYESNERLEPAYGSGPTERNHFGTGYYSRSDFIEILKYATERYITVIPEIESPGHARAAIKAMDARYDRLMREGKKDEAEQYLLHDIDDQSKYSSAQLFNDNVMNAALPSTYAFVDKVIGELRKMYDEAGAPLSIVHMGGDEVPVGAWEQSPRIQQYMKQNPLIKNRKDIYADFFVKTTGILAKHNVKITGWEEMIIDDPHIEASVRNVIDNKRYHADKLQFDAWWDIYGKQDMCYSIANNGYGVVLTSFDYFYFDLAQAPGFDEPGDAWIGYLPLQKTFAYRPFDIYNSYPLDMRLKEIEKDRFKDKPKLTEAGKKNIRGIQGALWAENMTYDGYMEYQVLPRLLALAERAWTPDPNWQSQEDFDKDWHLFLNRLNKRDLPRLDHYNGGYKYRPLSK
jgi:hexosaminidase